MKRFYLLLMLLLTPVAHNADAGQKVERIVSLGPINTENVYLLGAEDRLVGNTVYCVRPEAAKQIAKVGSVLQASLEKIINLDPDLILTTGLSQSAQLRQLKQLGYNVAHFDQPRSFEESCNHLIELGRLIGREEKARSIVSQLKERVRAITNAVGSYPPPRVAIQIGAEPLYLVGEDSFLNDFITLGGGINILEGKESGRVSYELVVQEDPEVIIIAIMGSETGVAAQEMKTWQKIEPISAVQDNRIHIINPDIACSPSPATFVSTLEIISHYLHPKAQLEVSP
ncbi:MAG: ABC transporter substrate-binding protein [Desulfobulbaceae bacterium]|nr:MAG: ABC transporter substrate-binding protein [Desulfobulbaceae bacterium]